MSTAQDLTGVSSCCVSGHLHSGQPKGTVKEIGGLSTYVTGAESNKAKTIFFITDIFGYDLPNARLLADEYADAGFYVVVPDLFNGDAVDHTLLDAIAPLPSAPAKSVTEKAKDTATLGVTLPPWLFRHREAVTKPIIDGFVKALKADPDIKRIGAVGFCWGGRYAVLLTHKTEEAQVDVAVANHPSFLAVPAELLPAGKPLLINVGDKDEMMSESDIIKTKEVFLKDLSGLTTKCNVYKGANHGFTIRSDLTQADEKQRKEEAAEATIRFFKENL